MVRWFVLKRLLYVLPTVLLGTLLVFVIVYLSPGNYATFMQATNPHLTESQVLALQTSLGLDQPVLVQYVHWLLRVCQGDLGRSFLYQQSIVSLVLPRLLNSLLIILFSTCLIYFFGFWIGIFSAVHRGQWREQFLNAVSYVFIGVPSFFLGLICIYWIVLLHQHYGIQIPLHGLTSENYDQLGFFQKGFDIFKHIIVPTLVTSIVSIAFISRFVRTQMLSFLHEDFIRTAYAKGLGDTAIIYKHTLKNAVLPFLSDIGGFLSGLISGAGLVEVVFNYPGLTPLFLQSIYAKDTPVIAGVTLVSMLILVLGNIVGDLILAWVDPRIRYEGA